MPDTEGRRPAQRPRVAADGDPDGGRSAGREEVSGGEVGQGRAGGTCALRGCCLPGRGGGRHRGHPVDLRCLQPASRHRGGAVTVTVSPAPAQTMQGFGASGAWWPNDLVSYPRRVQEKVADLLFSKPGIDLSVYRYNVGGGGLGVTDPTRAVQSFLTSPGAYKWSADAGGTDFLRLAHQHGVPILEGFANSAPPEWTTNAKNCGGQLVPGDEPAYADYLAQVARHLHNADGITLSYISPMNEPDNSFSSCGQEGMAVPVAQRAAVVQDLGQALARRAPYSKVIADESSLAYFQFLPEVPQWLSAPGASEEVAALAHHGYDYPTDVAGGPGRLPRDPVRRTPLDDRDLLLRRQGAADRVRSTVRPHHDQRPVAGRHHLPGSRRDR